MSDDDWGDDGGEDWGDDGDAGDDGGWDEDGDGGIEVDAENDFDELPIDGGDIELTTEVKLENAFYEAEDTRGSDPEAALEQFMQVIALGKEIGEDKLEGETLTFAFKARQHIVSLHHAAGSTEKMVEAYKDMLRVVPRVSKNDASEAIHSVLDACAESKEKDMDFIARIYRVSSETIRQLPEQERLLFRVEMRLGELLFDQGDFKGAEAVLGRLHKSCQTPDGKDDVKRGAELLEIYALSTRIGMATNNQLALRSLYEKTKDLTAAVRDPKSQSVIKECWGMMFGDRGSWRAAYGEFWTAFVQYQEIGLRDRAKRALKYVVIANMLSDSESNPFDAREAKAFMQDEDIKAIRQLLAAYDRSDVKGFTEALVEVQKADDTFINKHLHAMVRDFRARAIIQLLKSYRRVRIDHIAGILKIKDADVEELLIQLILDNRVVGKIDQVKGVLDLGHSVGGGAKYAACGQWADTLANMVRSLPPVVRSRGGGGRGGGGGGLGGGRGRGRGMMDMFTGVFGGRFGGRL